MLKLVSAIALLGALAQAAPVQPEPRYVNKFPTPVFNLRFPGTELCVAAPKENGARASLVPCGTAPVTNLIESVGDAHITFLPVRGRPDVCLDVTDGDALYAASGDMWGAPVQAWECFEENTNQKFVWNFKGHENEPFNWEFFTEEGTQQIQWEKDKSWCLTAARPEGGAGVVLGKCDSVPGWDRINAGA